MAQEKGTFLVEKEVKEAAEQVLRGMGMSLNTGINVFLAQVAREQALPFRPGKGNALKGKVSDGGDIGGLGDLGRQYDSNDPVVRKAIDITLKQGKFSTASIQTWLGKGHGFVTGLAIWLEEIGVIGPANGHKPRDVLIRTMEEFEERAGQ